MKTESEIESDKLENTNKKAKPKYQRNKIDLYKTEFDIEPDKFNFKNPKESEQEDKTNLKNGLSNECEIQEILTSLLDKLCFAEKLEQIEKEVEDRSVEIETINCDNGSVTQDINVPETNISKVNGNKDSATETSNKIRYVPLNVSIENVLKYKNPPNICSKRFKEKDKMPRAISSQAWRDLQNKKEVEKLKKAELIKRKKEERAHLREEKEKLKKIKTNKKKSSTSENCLPVKNKKTPKKVIKCDACDGELISDVEEDEEKNIGCDLCTRWFHLRCTDFIGFSYNEVATKYYTCYACS